MKHIFFWSSLRALRPCGELALLALLVLAGCGPKKTISVTDTRPLEKVTEKGPVKLTLRFAPREPRLSDLISLDMIVTADLDIEIKPPPFGQAVGDFLVRDYSDEPEKIENGKLVKRFHYQLEPTQAGTHLIRSVGVDFVDKRQNSESKDKAVRLESEPLEVVVTSELGDATPSLTDLAPMARPLPLVAGPLSPWTIAALCVLAAALIAAGVIFLRKKQQLAAVAALLTPEQIAQAELNALIAQQLPEKRLFGEFYVGLTGVVRRYIERTTGIHAPEQTTEEFLRDTQTRQVFTYERADRLGHFLEAADMVKYAALLPGQRQVDESVSRAREFVGLEGALSPMPGEAKC